MSQTNFDDLYRWVLVSELPFPILRRSGAAPNRRHIFSRSPNVGNLEIVLVKQPEK